MFYATRTIKINIYQAVMLLVLICISGVFVGAEGLPELKLGLHDLNPKDIRFTQPNVSPHFNNSERVDKLINQLKSGKISLYDIKPIQVVQKNGKLFSLDNRRLLAFNSAGVDKIPVEVVSLDDPVIADIFRDRFDPILNEGQYAIVVPKAERKDALSLLEEYGMIKGSSNGY